MQDNPIQLALLDKLTDEHDADIILCNAGMDRGLETVIVNKCRERNRRPNVVLILVTSGGNADVAFRIARYLQSGYSRFICLIPGWCKSAGTLLSLGATEVVFGIHGELGPLDVQMAKKDELLGNESGLTVMTALTAIHEKTLLAFEHFFLETTFKGAGRLTVQTASEIAATLAKGLFAPISQQIDPIHIGEAWRSMAIATEYGQRLIERSQNALPGALEKVISGYPSHGFVIDQIEAETIFKRVRSCTNEEQAAIDGIRDLALFPAPYELFKFLNEELPRTEDIRDANSDIDPQSQRNDRTSAQAGADVTKAESIETGSEAGIGGNESAKNTVN